jgi:hypothetical protein
MPNHIKQLPRIQAKADVILANHKQSLRLAKTVQNSVMGFSTPQSAICALDCCKM